MDEQLLIHALKGLPVPAIQYFDSLGSTNDLALQWAAQGAPQGALVYAETQTAGRGRFDRRWFTPPAAALAFSLILRPDQLETRSLGLFSPLAGLAVALSFEQFGLSPQIKWPNDVLLDRKKVCGVLVEAVWQTDQVQALVIGIGINVASSAVPPAADLIYPATSLQDVLGSPPDRPRLLASVLQNLFTLRSTLSDPSFMQLWQDRLAFRGEWVQVQQPGQPPVIGQLQGVDSEGCLLLLAASGSQVTIRVGDVHLRPNDDSQPLGGRLC